MKEEIDEGAEFARAFDRYLPVKIAFWLKESDDSQRYFYMASDQIDDTNFDLAYGEVIRLANLMHLDYFDPFLVKVLSANKPLARAAIEVNQHFPGRLGTRLGKRMLGDTYIDSAYIYPSPLPVSA